MVHEDGIGTGRYSGIQQLLGGRDATDQQAKLPTALDLQAIGAIILDTGRLQVTVGGFYQ